MKIEATCSTEFKAYHNSGHRKKTDIRYVVIHCTEGPTAKSAAEYFTKISSGGSTNLVLDDKICYKTLEDLLVPWGAPPLNTYGFHIEQAGYVEWSKEEWLLHTNTIKRCAYKTALRCHWYNIPTVFLSVQDLKDGKFGITSHNNISLAFHKTDHTDPGKHYPYDFYMEQVIYYFDHIKIPLI